MGARNAARIWTLAGIAITVLLVVASWFLVISPKYAKAADVQNQVEDTQTQLITLRKKIAGLDAQKAQLPKFKAALKANQKALPDDSGVPDFLRQLQGSGEKTAVSVSGFSVASPAQVVGLAGVWQLPITLIATGEPANLGQFLNDLQAVQPRAVLIQSANFTQGSSSTTDSTTGTTADDSAKTSLNLSLMAYVALPAGAGAPIVTTK
jgi:type IV pilus assembly protein PilO